MRRVRLPLVRGRTRSPAHAPPSAPLAGGSVVGAPLDAWAAQHGITRAELRVVHPCVRGLMNKEIARALGISGATVRAHLLSVFRKLGIATRGELAHVVFTLIESGTAELAEERRRLIAELEAERVVLERERTLLDAVLRQSPVGVIVADIATHRIVLANDEAVRLLGARPADVAEYFALMCPRHPGGLPFAPDESPIARVLAGAERVTAEVCRDGPGGAAMTLEMHVTPIRDRSGAVTAALAIFIDVTRRKAVEAELIAAETAAREALRTREEFMKVVSKDLCGPAENLVRLSEALAGMLALPVDDARNRAMRTARHLGVASRHLRRFLLDLVELGDLAAGRYVARPTTIDPRVLVSSAMRGAVIAAREAQVALESRVDADLPFVFVDVDRIAGVFATLLDRAIAASSPGARVVVEVRAAPEGVAFTVRDTGAPLPREHEARIFDPTWLVTVGAKRGLGLGLSVAREIVQRHLGRLWAESGPEGSAFHFTLPVT